MLITSRPINPARSESIRNTIPTVAATKAHCKITHLRFHANCNPWSNVQLPPVNRLFATPTSATLKKTITK